MPQAAQQRRSPHRLTPAGASYKPTRKLGSEALRPFQDRVARRVRRADPTDLDLADGLGPAQPHLFELDHRPVGERGLDLAGDCQAFPASLCAL